MGRASTVSAASIADEALLTLGGYPRAIGDIMGMPGLFELPFIIIFAPPIILAVIGVALYLLTLRMALEKTLPANRYIAPDAVWFILVPGVGVYCHFFTVVALSRAFRKEYLARGVRNIQGSYGLEPGVLLFIVNVLVIGWWFGAFCWPVDPLLGFESGGWGMAIVMFALIVQLTAVFAHWAVVACLLGDLPDRECQNNVPDVPQSRTRGRRETGLRVGEPPARRAEFEDHETR